MERSPLKQEKQTMGRYHHLLDLQEFDHITTDQQHYPQHNGNSDNSDANSSPLQNQAHI